MDTITIGVAQVPQTTDLPRNLHKALEYMDRAAEKEVEILCFPETHLAGYRVGLLSPDAPCDTEGLEQAVRTVSDRCRDLSMAVILGTETPNPSGKPFNSALVIDQEGRTVALHHKSRLTPTDARAYSPGSGPTLFQLQGVQMGLVICFEGLRFPETTRELAKAGAKVVFHPQANHFLPNMEWKLPVHEALIVARAAENTLYFVSANMCHARNNSRSLVVGPEGLIMEASTLAREMLLVADVDPDKATNAFLRDDPVAQMKVMSEV